MWNKPRPLLPIKTAKSPHSTRPFSFRQTYRGRPEVSTWSSRPWRAEFAENIPTNHRSATAFGCSTQCEKTVYEKQDEWRGEESVKRGYAEAWRAEWCGWHIRQISNSKAWEEAEDEDMCVRERAAVKQEHRWEREEQRSVLIRVCWRLKRWMIRQTYLADKQSWVWE